jgi:hypothetical protein
MAALTLDRVLADAAALPADEQEMLESLLSQRRIDSWRQETAAETKSAIKALHSGKFKRRSPDKLFACPRRHRNHGAL